MLITLNSRKKKNPLSKWSELGHRSYAYHIERFLVELAIKLFERTDIDQPRQKAITKRKSETYPSPSPRDLEKIAQNQLAYSKLLSERMNAAHRTKKKDKIVLLHR
ncbi:hypothetical protein [Maribacter luteus]|uniref:hypothetical protein n=1 Tax=Maribacter luteus TaxID=2594478 RepID=UPI0024912787|nr:hypothetical protein [Maribacter luteus]